MRDVGALEDPGNGAHGHHGLLHRFGIQGKAGRFRPGKVVPNPIPTIAAEVAAIQVERLAITALLDAESCEDAFRLAELRIQRQRLGQQGLHLVLEGRTVCGRRHSYPRGIHRLLVSLDGLFVVRVVTRTRLCYSGPGPCPQKKQAPPPYSKSLHHPRESQRQDGAVRASILNFAPCALD